MHRLLKTLEMATRRPQNARATMTSVTAIVIVVVIVIVTVDIRNGSDDQAHKNHLPLNSVVMMIEKSATIGQDLDHVRLEDNTVAVETMIANVTKEKKEKGGSLRKVTSQVINSRLSDVTD